MPLLIVAEMIEPLRNDEAPIGSDRLHQMRGREVIFEGLHRRRRNGLTDDVEVARLQIGVRRIKIFVQLKGDTAVLRLIITSVFVVLYCSDRTVVGPRILAV